MKLKMIFITAAVNTRKRAPVTPQNVITFAAKCNINAKYNNF